MQALPGLHALEAAFPGRVRAWLPGTLRRDFAPLLPLGWAGEAGLTRRDFAFALVRPADRLYVNAPGVWRVRFDAAARLCARASFGFRHAEESSRRAYTLALPLDDTRRDFASAFLELIAASGVSGVPSFPPAPPSAAQGAQAGKGVLFHIGSRGFRRALGDGAFVDLCETLLRPFAEVPVHLRYGPGDEAVAQALGSRSSAWNPEAPPPAELAQEVQSFRGAVMCFDSFFAHFCRYYGRPAWVLHRDRIPYGYDTGDLHRQWVLSGEESFERQAEALAAAMRAGGEFPVSGA